MKITRLASRLVVIVLALVACATPPPAPEQDFGFSLDNTVFEAIPDSRVITSVTITPINGFTGTVDLALANRDGSPSDPGVSIDPGAITVAGSLSGQSLQRQIAIDVAAGVATGSYALTLTASSQDLVSEADLDLGVVASLQPEVAVASPSDGTVVTGGREVTLAGTLSSPHPIVAVDILGGADLLSLTFDQNAFSAIVELENGVNDVRVSATDDRGVVGVSEAVALTFPFLDLANFQEASVVIGQPDFESNGVNQGGAAAANTLDVNVGNPFVTESGVLFLPDGHNNRVLGFHQIPTTNDASADFVLGQPDFATVTPGTSAIAFDDPISIHSDGTRLAIVDNDNHRVLIWNTIPTSTQAPADLVVGQPDFASNTPGCAADTLSSPDTAIFVGGKLIVSDRDNHRVLIWNEVPTLNGEPADLVLGQDSFITCTANDDDQNGVADGAPTARTLITPTDVWSDGERLVVSEFFNNRVLMWHTLPTANFTPADRVVGQPDFVSNTFGTDAQTFGNPRHAFSNGNQLIVIESNNARILIYDAMPTVSGQPADRVLGQGSFTNGAFNDDDQDGVASQATARTLNFPAGGVVFEERLLVLDSSNSRVLIFEGR